MQPYQAYYPNNYQTMQNPYIDNRLNYLQQFQQSLQPSQITNGYQSGFNQGINGKVVESIDIVKTTDIPMDGNAYYFPKADGTEIYSKQWLSNGQTRILTFKPLLEDNPNNLSSEEEKLKLSAFNEVLGALEIKVDALSSKLDEFLKQKTTTRAKKEVANDE